jgi:hypothetical protein
MTEADGGDGFLDKVGVVRIKENFTFALPKRRGSSVG